MVNSYVVKPYPMAKRMRDFFEGHLNLLNESVVFPTLFFRSESTKYWKRRVAVGQMPQDCEIEVDVDAESERLEDFPDV